MIPLRDENPTRTTPFVVLGLVILNIVIYVYNGPLSRTGQNPLAGFELVPYEVVTGRNVGPALLVPPWVTVFSSMFMHANLLHIAGNMLYLWIFGNNIEDTLGHVRFFLFYLASGIAAALGQILIAPFSTVPMVGASGAIAGVLGAYLILFPGARITSLVFLFVFVQVVELPASLVLGLWIIIQVVSLGGSSAAGGGVAYAAHVGGFLAGVVLIYMLGGKRLLRRRRPSLYERYHDRYREW